MMTYSMFYHFCYSAPCQWENCFIVDKICTWLMFYGITTPTLRNIQKKQKHVAFKVILFSPYLHGALHDRDSHDSIFYGDCFSVHEPGMGCKVKIKTVPWEWCCLAGFNNSYTFKCICFFALPKTMITIKFKKYTLLIDRNYYGYPILLIHQQNAEIYVVIFVPTPPKQYCTTTVGFTWRSFMGKRRTLLKKQWHLSYSLPEGI